MKKTALLVFAILLFQFSHTQPGYTPSAENLRARQWFDSARFGMFIHWGASSLLGYGEWVMNNRNIHVPDYNRLVRIFNPIAFDAQKWVSTAKNAGMKYITLITRHHDGFSLWDTKQSEWKVTNTPYQKDVVKQMADECHRQGIKLFCYYSLLDWDRDDYQWQTGRTGKGTGRTGKSDWEHYVAFMKAQLTELLTNYGEISGIWFDGHWDQQDDDKDPKAAHVNWHYDEIYKLIHQLQPQCLIGNNHHRAPFEGEDFQMFEKDLPGHNTTGFGGSEVSKLSLETCETLNDSWGFNITDRNYKSVKDLVQYLVKAAGYGANFLLNIGPLPNGEIQPEFSERLQAMGQWLSQNGETIYGTTGGFISPQEWGAITEKGNRIFIHLLNAKSEKLFLKLPGKIKSAKAFAGKSPVKFQSLPEGYVMIDINSLPKQEYDTIIEVEITR